MADPQLVQALDYILNRSDEASIEVLAEAVVRRRREIYLTGGALDLPDPQRVAQELTGQLKAGVGASVEGLKNSVREMTVRIIREQAPELTGAQVEELCRAWLPGKGDRQGAQPPKDMLVSMIEQFVAFSRGSMSEAQDKTLRDELGAWPERYWNMFPPVIRLIITDFLKDKITARDFNSKIAAALDLD
jgi:hypothetical protein